MWEMIRGYLTFTRKERYGVLFLLLVMTVLFVLPYLFRPAIGTPDPEATEKMKEGIRKFESQENDSSSNTGNHDRYKMHDESQRGYVEKYNTVKASLFYFDPNTLDAEGWQRLGLSDRLIHTILNYVGKGGRFKQGEDLRKLYGLHNADYERLLPYVRIPKAQKEVSQFPELFSKPSFAFQGKTETDSFSGFRRNNFLYPEKKFSIIDINLADSARWEQLPGIGASLASRIIHFREKLGGFYKVDQVGETFGLSDSTFQKIKPWLVLSVVNLNHINLNTASKETLQAHPYIRWQIANGIVEYRLQHGAFHDVDELMQLAQIDSAKYLRLKPYLDVSLDQDRQ